jgi:hypothetical protein
MGRQCDEYTSSKQLRTTTLSVTAIQIWHHTHQGNDLCWFGDQSVGQLFVERDEVTNIDVAIVLFEEHVLTDLISKRTLAVANT